MTDLTFRHAQITDLETLIKMLADDPLGAQREDSNTPINPSYIKNFNAINKI